MCDKAPTYALLRGELTAHKKLTKSRFAGHRLGFTGHIRNPVVCTARNTGGNPQISKPRQIPSGGTGKPRAGVWQLGIGFCMTNSSERIREQKKIIWNRTLRCKRIKIGIWREKQTKLQAATT